MDPDTELVELSQTPVLDNHKRKPSLWTVDGIETPDRAALLVPQLVVRTTG
jgi:hypothetical protein